MKPIRFTVQFPFAKSPGQAPVSQTPAGWLTSVKRFEDQGFWAVSVPEHLGRALPQYAPMVALAAAAAQTSALRLATTVICNDFHHPAVLAREAATLDQFSGGRLVFGIGAGWMESDYTETGMSWDRPGVRINRLAESVAVIKRLLRDEEVTFQGSYYTLRGHRTFPQPLQQPVPIAIGGGGKKILAWAAREADSININTPLDRSKSDRAGDVAMDAFRQQLSWISDAAGPRIATVHLGVRVLYGGIGPDGLTAARRAAEERGVAETIMMDSPFALFGSTERVRDHLHRMREEYGITSYTINASLADELAPVLAEVAGS